MGIIILLFDGWDVSVDAHQTITLTPETQFEFADSLYRKNDYTAAKIEFQKFLFFFPQDARGAQAKFKIGMSLFYQKDYENALHQFRDVLDQYGPTEIGIESGLYLSRCHMAFNDVESAVHTLQVLVGKTNNLEHQQKIYYQLAWIYLETGDFQNAYLNFEKINLAGKSDYPVESIVQAMNDSPKIPSKSPLLAGFLSVFPGGGYAYCGRYNDALISLLINSACAASAYECFDKELNVLGGMIAAVGIGFYGGNIYGGVSSAHKYNTAKKNEFMNNLKNQFNFDVMANADPDSVMIKIQHRF
jgi:tetratricopeptide (TPR) repeat protein